MTVITQIVKAEFTEEEKKLLRAKVDRFTEGEMCDGIDCNRIECSPDCPIYKIDEQAKELRKAVLKLIEEK